MKKRITEPKALLEQKRKELVQAKFDLKLKKLKNVHRLKSIRKEIAQILTMMREKELLDESRQ